MIMMLVEAVEVCSNADAEAASFKKAGSSQNNTQPLEKVLPEGILLREKSPVFKFPFCRGYQGNLEVLIAASLYAR